jgi:hypothetical protein
VGLNFVRMRPTKEGRPGDLRDTMIAGIGPRLSRHAGNSQYGPGDFALSSKFYPTSEGESGGGHSPAVCRFWRA